jgi:hypothetical protein
MAIAPKTIPVTVVVTVRRSWKSYLAEFACWMILALPLSYLLYLNLIGAL